VPQNIGGRVVHASGLRRAFNTAGSLEISLQRNLSFAGEFLVDASQLLNRGTAMSVSAIPTNTFSPYQFTSSNPAQTQLQQLSQALQSGNLSGAQSDFATLQQAFSQSATTTGSASGNSATNPLTQAFNQLGSDLQSGNLSAAQKDLSTVQQDVQNSNSSPSRFGHHLHHGGVPQSQGQNSLFPDVNQPAQSSTSSGTTGAQAAFSALQQQLQQYALGGAASLSSESPISFDA
jgi:hypothetical protein